MDQISEVNPYSLAFKTEELKQLLIAKNTDYGNSVQEQFEKYGYISLLVRIDDKMRRLETLLSKSKEEQQVKTESIADTFMDLAGYSVIAAILFSIEGDTQDESE